MARVNFNIDNDDYKELKIFSIRQGFVTLTDLFKSWIKTALHQQREQDKNKK